MSIGSNIRKLLEEGQKVVLPGFGNLEIKESSGSPASRSGQINPPGKKAVFDSSYGKDDGLLAGTYAESDGLDAEEATQQVLELVDAIRFSLDRGEKHEVPDAGEFSRDDDGKVHFQHTPEWILDPDQYGLETMDLLELEDEKPEEPEERLPPVVPPPEPAAEPAAEPQEEVSEVPKTEEPQTEEPEAEEPEAKEPREEEEPQEEEEPKAEEELQEEKPEAEEAKEEKSEESGSEPAEKETELPPPPPAPVPHREAPHAPWKEESGGRKKSRLWRLVWIIAAILVVVLAVLILLPSEPSGDNVPTTPPATDTPITTEDAEAQTGEQAAEEQVPEEQPAETGPAENTASGSSGAEGPEEEVLEEKNPYCIIAGSFTHLGNASDLQDQLRAEGFPAEVMQTENRMYRVIVSTYASKSEAERKLSEMRSVPGLESVWLLVNE